MPRPITAGELGAFLPHEGLCWISACSTESAAFREGLSGLSRPGLTFTSVFVPGLNKPSYLLETGGRVTTFFMLPELGSSDRVDFLPLCYRDIRGWLETNTPDVALVMCTPPDASGRCSFGPVTDFIADLWERIPVLIAHINPAMRATHGTPGIPFDRFSAFIEAPQALPQSDPGTDEISDRIAAHAARVIPDGATIQAGIGRVPEAVLCGLGGKRNLSIHSGLIGDSTLKLLEAGALRRENPITAGVAIGTERLYEAVGRAEFNFRPPSFTHDIATLGQIQNLVTVNSAIEVDIDGQAYAEMTPRGLISGPGGASDFAAGARGNGGLRILVLPGSAGGGKISRIIGPDDAVGPVSLGRFDTDLVITEHGVADLRSKSKAARREALIAVADPAFRSFLREKA